MTGRVAKVLILSLGAGLAGGGGCGRAPADHTVTVTGRDDDSTSDADRTAVRATQVEVSQIIDKMSQSYQPVNYQYDEDLLTKLDAIERHLGEKQATPVGRQMPGLDQAEEDDHFRVTIQRWGERTKRDFRRTLDELNQAAASLDKSKSFHPEFHALCAPVLDPLIAIEIAEMRERRNRAIHRAVKPLLDAQRAKNPAAVADLEATLNQPPYSLPAS